MLVAYNYEGCSSAPLTQYKNIEIYEEMIEEDEFTTDDRILIDMRRSKGYTDQLEKLNRDNSGIGVVITFKEVAAKKLRLRVTGFCQTEYWYLLSSKGYIMSYKNYNISKVDELWIIKITILNAIKWDEKDIIRKKEEEKEDEEFRIFIKTEFYSGKKPQTGSGAISRVVARLLENVGDVIGLWWLK